MRARLLPAIRLTFLGLVWILGLHGVLRADSTCTHYASPAGAGSGVSSSQPFKIADFWRHAKPGYTLCRLNGNKTGPGSMINAPRNLSGRRGMPITVKALNAWQSVDSSGQLVNQLVLVSTLKRLFRA